jgi:hypothetical protein
VAYLKSLDAADEAEIIHANVVDNENGVYNVVSFVIMKFLGIS